MNKELVKELAKATDCSPHSPLWIEFYTEQVVLECIHQVLFTPTHMAYTSYDLSIVNATLQQATKTIKERFEL